jgi:hypothetical protein
MIIRTIGIIAFAAAFVAVTTFAAEEPKPPAGKPALHCVTMDSRCEASLLEKLKLNPRYSGDAEKIVAEARSDYAKARSSHPEASVKARGRKSTGQGGVTPVSAYWYCYYGYFMTHCLGDDGLDIWF